MESIPVPAWYKTYMAWLMPNRRDEASVERKRERVYCELHRIMILNHHFEGGYVGPFGNMYGHDEVGLMLRLQAVADDPKYATASGKGRALMNSLTQCIHPNALPYVTTAGVAANIVTARLMPE
jgi:hypothetical protein